MTSGLPNPSHKPVIILTGQFAGEEGVCLGPAPAGRVGWAVSPSTSNKILYLKIEVDFGILVNRRQAPTKG